MRQCDKCGETYYRRNQISLWVLRNPGKRRGWRQRIYALCLSCLSLPVARRLLVLTGLSLRLPSVSAVPTPKVAQRVAARVKSR